MWQYAVRRAPHLRASAGICGHDQDGRAQITVDAQTCDSPLVWMGGRQQLAPCLLLAAGWA